jgi:hypothetical protein
MTSICCRIPALRHSWCALLRYFGTLLRMIRLLPVGTTHADNIPVISERVWSGHMTVKWISCTDNHMSTCQTSQLPPIGVTMARLVLLLESYFSYSINYPPIVQDKKKTKYKILVSFISPSFGWWCQKSQTILWLACVIVLDRLHIRISLVKTTRFGIFKQNTHHSSLSNSIKF